MLRILNLRTNPPPTAALLSVQNRTYSRAKNIVIPRYPTVDDFRQRDFYRRRFDHGLQPIQTVQVACPDECMLLPTYATAVQCRLDFAVKFSVCWTGEEGVARC